MTRTLAYYPGCSLHGTSGEFDASFKATARALDLVLQEIPGWECCGNTAAHSINRLLSVALPVNELAKVEQDMKLDAVAVPCAACYSRFKTGAHEITESAETAADVRAVVGRAYNGGVEVDNLIDVYHDAVGLDDLKAKVTRPFDGLKVACYYGCLLTRPPKVTLADDPEYPTHMDEVVKALGCTPVDWNYKTDCCGASLALTEQDIVDDLVGRIVKDARDCGADAVAVACPLCQVNLDGRQIEIAKKDAGWQHLPVIFLSQLVGRAIGIDDKTLGLKKHLVDVTAAMA
ncbi:MAG TPA: CoB--CoM heterodisulfide reductase iron-sulfur subunit B family protein [Thermoleophilia bacterium]|nr:CoB--CoM heterodisulfide reductase iron-sulfur subunit B family protein [Thermoleophilia bacterium]